MSGRLTRYSDEAYTAVIKDIAEGIPLSSALGGESRPGRTAFFQRLKEDPALGREYDAAMQQRAQVRVDALLEINERLLRGTIDPGSAKVASQNLMWLAGKESPRQYGEVSRQEISGPEGKNLFPEKDKVSDLELARYIAYVLNKGEYALNAGTLRALPDPSQGEASE